MKTEKEIYDKMIYNFCNRNSCCPNDIPYSIKYMLRLLAEIVFNRNNEIEKLIERLNKLEAQNEKN